MHLCVNQGYITDIVEVVRDCTDADLQLVASQLPATHSLTSPIDQDWLLPNRVRRIDPRKRQHHREYPSQFCNDVGSLSSVD